MGDFDLDLMSGLAALEQSEKESDSLPAEWTFYLLVIVLIERQDAFRTERMAAGRRHLVCFGLWETYWTNLVVHTILSSLALLLIFLYPDCVAGLIGYELTNVLAVVDGESGQR